MSGALGTGAPGVGGVLRTDRLTLRGWEPDDTGFVFDLYSRWDVQRFLGPDPRVMDDPARAVALIQRLRAFDRPRHRYWAVETTSGGDLVGTVMLQPIRLSGTPSAEGSTETEIGWHFHPDHWGRGYATEAAGAVLAHALRADAEPIVAVTHPDNLASQRVCERIGMTRRGRTDRYYDAVCELFVAERAH